MTSGFRIAPKYSENAYERLFYRIPQKKCFLEKSPKLVKSDCSLPR